MRKLSRGIRRRTDEVNLPCPAAMSGIVSDGAGNLFVADSRNQTIRKVVIATGQVTTLAGLAGQMGDDDGVGPAARFNTPTSLAYEAGNLFVLSGNLFVLSGGIRKVVIATGVVTTMRLSIGAAGRGDAGSDTPIFKDPRGITSDGDGNLYVVDAYLHTVLVKLLGGAGQDAGLAPHSSMAGLASDGAGTCSSPTRANRSS